MNVKDDLNRKNPGYLRDGCVGFVGEIMGSERKSSLCQVFANAFWLIGQNKQHKYNDSSVVKVFIGVVLFEDGLR